MQSNELQIIVACEANREYNNKGPSYLCVRREVPNIFSIKITNIPTNNTTCKLWPTEKVKLPILVSFL